jgi:hypothetical protein
MHPDRPDPDALRCITAADEASAADCIDPDQLREVWTTLNSLKSGCNCIKQQEGTRASGIQIIKIRVVVKNGTDQTISFLTSPASPVISPVDDRVLRRVFAAMLRWARIPDTSIDD